MIRQTAIFLGILLAGALAAAPLAAMESAPVSSERLVATLVSDTDAVQAGTPFHLGLRLRIKPGWHTYWRNPGDAGAPPEFTLSLPQGATATGIIWPAPVRQPEGPLMTYAYTGDVTLPVTVLPGEGGLTVTASATWLVCAKICVPEEGTFHLTLPAGVPSASAQEALFAAAATRAPRSSPFEARVSADGQLSLAGTDLSAATVRDAWFFPSESGSIDLVAPQAVRISPGLVTIDLKPAGDYKFKSPLAGVVVLRDPGGQELFLDVVAAPGEPIVSAVPLGRLLALAALGGLLLNLMPCVFPLLAMKAVGLARLSGASRAAVRWNAIAYTGGVLVTFVALGGTLLVVRGLGGVVGWGFQFQSPVFVAATAWMLFVLGLNLSGVFQIGGSFTGVGQGLAGRGGAVGSFFTGILAVIVAAPCTAPFMGAAIATALAASTGMGILIFAVMGVGLAAPYALLAFIPGLARLLPRPGVWMDVFKGILAFPMYAAAVWLLWVVTQQTGPDGVLISLTGIVLLGFAAWVFGLTRQSSRLLGGSLAAIAVLVSLCLLPLMTIVPAPQTSVASEGAEPFTPARLEALRAEGRPVFVNMTAAWCVSCLVNERVALARPEVQSAFRDRGVVYLKGDWTRADPAVTTFLREHERDGVPLYVLYPPQHGTPRVLPQILTTGDILSELQKAGG